MASQVRKKALFTLLKHAYNTVFFKGDERSRSFLRVAQYSTSGKNVQKFISQKNFQVK